MVHERLTGRQREIVDLARQGLKNQDIARKLDISPKTIDAHKAKISSALGINSAMAWARGVQATLEEDNPPELDQYDNYVLAHLASAVAFPLTYPSHTIRHFTDILAMELDHAREVIKKLEDYGYIQKDKEGKGELNTTYIITASGWQRIFPYMLEKAKQVQPL